MKPPVARKLAIRHTLSEIVSSQKTSYQNTDKKAAGFKF